MFMAKRRAEDTLLHDSPSKRCCRSLYSVDMQRVNMDPTGGVSPPSLLALLGSRSRKRPLYFQDTEKLEREEVEACLYRKATHCATRKHSATALTERTSGNFQDSRSPSSALISSKKRPREDCAGTETVMTEENDKAVEDPSTEDCAYNSFQYWRVPLPELDLSLLEDASDHSQTEKRSNVKDSNSDAMET